MKTILLYRNVYLKQEILGNLFIFDGSKLLFRCKTIELAWRDNKKNISCVPHGKYPLVFEKSNKFKRKLWELKKVPNRSEIKIHIANYYRDLNGCIAVGDMHTRIDSDPYPDVRNSRYTLSRLHKAMGRDTKAEIHIIG